MITEESLDLYIEQELSNLIWLIDSLFPENYGED